MEFRSITTLKKQLPCKVLFILCTKKPMRPAKSGIAKNPYCTGLCGTPRNSRTQKTLWEIRGWLEFSLERRMNGRFGKLTDIQGSDDIAKPQDCDKTVDTCHLLNCSRNSMEMWIHGQIECPSFVEYPVLANVASAISGFCCCFFFSFLSSYFFGQHISCLKTTLRKNLVATDV